MLLVVLQRLQRRNRKV